MHRTPAWDPVPGTFADSRELAALTGALKDFGAGVFELIPYGGAGEDAAGLAQEYEWMVPLAQQSGRPFSLALVQNVAYPDAWREAIERAGAAADQGARIVPQTAVRSVGVLFGCGLAISPLNLFPGCGELLDKTVEEQRRMLRDPSVQARLRDSIAQTSGDILGGMTTIDNVYPLEDKGALAYETAPERSVAGIARRQGKRPLDVVLDLLLEHDLRNFFMVPLFNFDLEAAGEMLCDQRTTIGLGDSGAHTTQTSDSGFPTFVLSYWVRHRKRLTIEAAVKKLTSDLAHLWGIRDRGVLARGAYADVNVIDFERVDLETPQLRHDFPAGAPHLHQGARGYAATVINGRVLMRDGAHTGDFPGRLLRNEKCS
jgi:N-acyl-D-aspartate/D-glutamate deacylase